MPSSGETMPLEKKFIRNGRNQLVGSVTSGYSDIVEASDREVLRSLLEVSSGGVVFTTIQKFLPSEGDRYPKLSDRRNVIVIADEAHRSQYDFIDGFARHMRDALPRASFIGFTGTPIEKGDANTRSVFGEYISIYDIQRAVEDKATVPIYYESRLAKLELPEKEKPRVDADFEEATEGEEVERRERLRTKWAAMEAIVGTQKRLGIVAKDLVRHFEERLEAMDGKGMVVCMSRRICVDLYNEIVKLRPDWHNEEEIRACVKQHRGNHSVVSTMLNTLLAWPDHPYGFGTLYGSEFNPETRCRERFVIAETMDLDKNQICAKERALLSEIKAQLERGRKCHVYAVFTTKHDVVARLEGLMRAEKIRAAVLRASVPAHKREAWYREQLRRGIDVAICHPKICETGLDLVEFPVILFHETGYSLHTLRQASRRSWRIGQRSPVECKFFIYRDTMQDVCLRLMGKKLLVALAMEGKFASEGLQAIDGEDDMLTAMARELVENRGIGEPAESIWNRISPAPILSDADSAKNATLQAEVETPVPLPLVSEPRPCGAFSEDPTTGSSRERDEATQLSLF
jgi:hypothetical protein